MEKDWKVKDIRKFRLKEGKKYRITIYRSKDGAASERREESRRQEHTVKVIKNYKDYVLVHFIKPGYTETLHKTDLMNGKIEYKEV